jgi:hypothetical protein
VCNGCVRAPPDLFLCAEVFFFYFYLYLYLYLYLISIFIYLIIKELRFLISSTLFLGPFCSPTYWHNTTFYHCTGSGFIPSDLGPRTIPSRRLDVGRLR